LEDKGRGKNKGRLKGGKIEEKDHRRINLKTLRKKIRKIIMKIMGIKLERLNKQIKKTMTTTIKTKNAKKIIPYHKFPLKIPQKIPVKTVKLSSTKATPRKTKVSSTTVFKISSVKCRNRRIGLSNCRLRLLNYIMIIFMIC
jgi:hypothetical protein